MVTKNCHRTILAICMSPANLRIARTPEKFQHIFPYVVTYRLGAGRRLCTIISADAGAVRRFVRFLVKYTPYGGRR